MGTGRGGTGLFGRPRRVIGWHGGKVCACVLLLSYVRFVGGCWLPQPYHTGATFQKPARIIVGHLRPTRQRCGGLGGAAGTSLAGEKGSPHLPKARHDACPTSLRHAGRAVGSSTKPDTQPELASDQDAATRYKAVCRALRGCGASQDGKR
jgi:hypothetical protein